MDMSEKRRMRLALRWMLVIGVLHLMVLMLLAHFGIGTIAVGPPRAAPLHNALGAFAMYGLFDPLFAMLMTGVICLLLTTDETAGPAADAPLSYGEFWAFCLTLIQIPLLIALIVCFILKDPVGPIVWPSLILGFVAGLLLSTLWQRMYGRGSALVTASVMTFPSVIIFSLAYGFPAGAVLWIAMSSAVTLVSLLLIPIAGAVRTVCSFTGWASVGRWLAASDMDPSAAKTEPSMQEPSNLVAEHDQLMNRLLAIGGDREKLDQEEQELLERKQTLENDPDASRAIDLRTARPAS